MRVHYETEQLMNEKLRSAREYAEEGKDSRAIWYLIQLMELIFEEIEVIDDSE